jgi:hypothetical protein
VWRDADFRARSGGMMVATPTIVGNHLTPVSGTIVVDPKPDATSTGGIERRSGPRFPRPHLQRLETQPEPPARERASTSS